MEVSKMEVEGEKMEVEMSKMEVDKEKMDGEVEMEVVLKQRMKVNNRVLSYMDW